MRVGPALFWIALACARPLAAQDSTVAPVIVPDSLAPQPATVDSAAVSSRASAGVLDSVPLMRPPVSPMGAFWRSLLVPGWGQATLGRRTAGAFFLGFEGVALGMTLTTSSQLKQMRATNSGSSDAKAQQHQDWLVLLGVNHLLAAMEAYVSAHLWDFPGDLSIQASPHGVSGSVSVPVRLP